MTPRKGESRQAFRERRAAFDQSRPDVERGRKMPDADVAKLEKDNAALRKEIARRDAAEREAKLAGSMRFDPLIIDAAQREPGSGGMPMMIWSDWHWGETVDPRETGGLNSFNLEIAEGRVKNLVRNTVHLLRDHTGGVDNGIVVMLGGDMVSGLIHQELVETNWGNIADQCYECGGAIVGGLKALAGEFGHVQLIAGVPGNHARTTLKPTAKGRLDSYDRTIYRSVAAQLADDDRFAITYVDDIDYRFRVYNTTFFLTHGDSQGVKGGDGIIGSLGPIIRGLIKTRTAEAQVGRDFDVMVEGHWHQYIPWSQAAPVIVNGT